MLKFNLIAAECENGGIGYENQLPWAKHLPNEWQHFDSMTRSVQDPNKTNVVILGRLTWESLGAEHRPLKDRINIVISGSLRFREETKLPGVFVCSNWSIVLQQLHKLMEQNLIEKIWVAGGQGIYQFAIDSLYVHQIFLTKIHKLYECDTFFPKFDERKYIIDDHASVSKEVQIENGVPYYFKVFTNILNYGQNSYK